MSQETDDADKVFAKINKLLSLVESSNENEARNAAWQAMKLIKSSGVLGLTIDGYVYALIDGEMKIIKKEKTSTQAPAGWVQTLGNVADAADILERAINGTRGQSRSEQLDPNSRRQARKTRSLRRF